MTPHRNNHRLSRTIKVKHYSRTDFDAMLFLARRNPARDNGKAGNETGFFLFA